jgi:hypothetical protein
MDVVKINLDQQFSPVGQEAIRAVSEPPALGAYDLDQLTYTA